MHLIIFPACTAASFAAYLALVAIRACFLAERFSVHQSFPGGALVGIRVFIDGACRGGRSPAARQAIFSRAGTSLCRQCCCDFPGKFAAGAESILVRHKLDSNARVHHIELHLFQFPIQNFHGFTAPSIRSECGAHFIQRFEAFHVRHKIADSGKDPVI